MYQSANHGKVTLNVMLYHVNDGVEHAHQLAEVLKIRLVKLI